MAIPTTSEMLVYGVTVDAPQWNAVVGDIQNLAALNPVVGLDTDVSLNSVSATTVETTVYSVSVPGGTLGTRGGLVLDLMGDMMNTSGTSCHLYWRVRFGSTVIWSHNPGYSNAANRGFQQLHLLLHARGATNAQIAYGILNSSDGTENNISGVATQKVDSGRNLVYDGGHVAIAEDSTTAKTLSISVQHDINHASTVFRCHTVTLVRLTT